MLCHNYANICLLGYCCFFILLLAIDKKKKQANLPLHLFLPAIAYFSDSSILSKCVLKFRWLSGILLNLFPRDLSLYPALSIQTTWRGKLRWRLVQLLARSSRLFPCQVNPTGGRTPRVALFSTLCCSQAELAPRGHTLLNNPGVNFPQDYVSPLPEQGIYNRKCHSNLGSRLYPVVFTNYM